MNPFYFGTGKRRLFGLYTPARPGPGRAKAAVLCPPWGQEYIRAHRSMRQLATMLSDRGSHVLRFDYFGTGDSSGEMTDADIPGWHDDIEMAIDELRDTTDAPRVGLVGLRLGATLAAGVAARRRDVTDALVLWDPIVSGDEYLRELLHASGPVKPRAAAAGGGYEVLGFPLSESMLAGFKLADLLCLVPDLPKRTMVIAAEPLASHHKLDVALVERSLEPLVRDVGAAHFPWLKGPEGSDGAVPVSLLQRICQWLA